MKTKLLSLTLLILSFIVTAQANPSGSTTASWVTVNCNNPVTATVSQLEAMSLTGYSIGNDLICTNTTSLAGMPFSRLQPASKTSAATQGNEAIYFVKPAKGLTFTPTQISFKTARFGTNGGLIDLVAQLGDGAEITLQTGIVPARDNEATPFTSVTLPISGFEVIDEVFALKMYIYNLDNNKQVGFTDVVISGDISGTLVSVEKFSFTTEVYPVNAGQITVNPNGTQFDEGSVVTLAATRNFGYRFLNWVDADNNLLSEEPTFAYTVNGDTHAKAMFESIQTHELKVDVDGDAKSYMISYSPQGQIIEGKRMYEGGTLVTLTAAGNPILLFTNWSTGETNPVKTILMDQPHDITVSYSAVDYVVGWDFYQSGNNSLSPAFSNGENETASLILRNEAGTIGSWLDKSQAQGGYEGKNAAVNWRPFTDKFYYQISFDASNYTDIKVASEMLFNYNAYSVQQVEFSLDGENFEKVGEVNLNAQKVWFPSEFTLPALANHQSKVYIRWIPNYASTILGTASTNDGTAIAAIYVTGTESIFNDGKAPELVKTVPTSAATNASSTGKIVLTFNKPVAILVNRTASLGHFELQPIVSGRTITFDYIGLDYDTAYEFVLAANSVSDLSGNTLDTPISIPFTTMNRPTVAKKLYDAIVSNAAELLQALEYAKSAATGERYRIFLKDGEYDLGSGVTSITTNNISLIGQSHDGVLIYNRSIEEGISITSTIFLQGAQGFYAQDLRMQNKFPYDAKENAGRAVVLRDTGTKNIFKNISLLSFQDTYYSGNSGRMYFEDCAIHGVVDFICGGSDIYFNRTRLVLEERGNNVITAPSTASTASWGYIFGDCTIDAVTEAARKTVNGNYSLGRPWNNAPRAVYLNTAMNVLPLAEGWTNMSTTILPALFAEYNSRTASGALVDVSNRKTQYTAGTVSYNPVLTTDEAAKYTIENVLSGEDGWIPTFYTEQATAPNVTLVDNTIAWNNNNYASCYVIFKDGQFKAQTTLVEFELTEEGVYTICAANEMGGLSPISNPISYFSSSIESAPATKSAIITVEHHTIRIRQIHVGDSIQIVSTDGRTVYRNISDAEEVVIRMGAFKGVAIVRIGTQAYKVIL